MAFGFLVVDVLVISSSSFCVDKVATSSSFGIGCLFWCIGHYIVFNLKEKSD
jgi:hypothetical protein